MNTEYTPKHYSWPSIEQFSHVRREVRNRTQFQGLDANNEPIINHLAESPTISYRGTVKLHGTSAAIVYNPDGTFYAQSRSNVITPTKDNAGFARFVHMLPESVHDTLRKRAVDGLSLDTKQSRVVVYGEWAGPGIQAGVAISKLPQKTFFIFGVRIFNLSDDPDDTVQDRSIALAGETIYSLPDHNIHNILDFPTYKMEIDMERPEECINKMNALTLEVEKECPVAKAFGIQGIGEGIVWSPTYNPDMPQNWHDGRFNSSRFRFKVKGAEHSKSHVKTLATVDVEKFKNLEAFVDNVLNNARLEQGWDKLVELHLPQDVTSTGKFLSWVVADIIKENQPEMIESNISDKEVGKHVQLKARRWYMDKVNKQ